MTPLPRLRAWPVCKAVGWLLLLPVVACWSALGQVSPLPEQRRAAVLQQGGSIDLSHGPKYVSDRVLVRFRSGTSGAAMEAVHQGIGSKVLSEPAVVDRLQVVQLPKNVTVREAIRVYRGNSV